MLEIKRSIARGWGTGGLFDILKQLQNLSVLTEGKVYYVAKAGNNTTGLSWKNAFTTIAAAITASNATISWSGNEEDNVILIAPGTYAESLTIIPYYCHMIGLGVPSLGTSAGVKISPSSGVCMSGTGLGMHLYNIAFLATGSVDILDFGICNKVLIDKCSFEPKNNSVSSAISTEDAHGLIVRDCKFETGDGSIGFSYGIYAAGGANKYFHNCLIENNYIGGLDPTGTGIYIHGNCVATETIIRNNIIRLTGAGTGIDDNSDNIVVVGNKVFHISGDAYDMNAKLAADNWDNNNGTLIDEPNMA